MAKSITSIVIGFMFIVGAIATWHYIDLDGFVAFLMGLVGISAMRYGFETWE